MTESQELSVVLAENHALRDSLVKNIGQNIALVEALKIATAALVRCSPHIVRRLPLEDAEYAIAHSKAVMDSIRNAARNQSAEIVGHG